MKPSHDEGFDTDTEPGFSAVASHHGKIHHGWKRGRQTGTYIGHIIIISMYVRK